MFKIDFRINENDEWIQNVSTKDYDKDDGGIEGFLMLTVGNDTYGYCPSRPLQEGEFDSILIDTWMRFWVSALVYLPKTGYVAFRDIETPRVWIEVKHLENDDVTISVVYQVNSIEKEGPSDLLITRPLVDFYYDEKLTATVSFDVFKTEVLDNAIAFVKQAWTLNSNLISSMLINELIEKINEIK